MTHKIDLNKLPLSALYKFLTSKQEFQDILVLLDSTVEGGIMSLPVSELPSLMAEFISEYQKNIETIAIAMGSMKNYLDGNEGT